MSLGLEAVQAARDLGLSRSTVSSRASSLGFPVDERFGRRYHWHEIQNLYDEGHDLGECVTTTASHTWGGRNARRAEA